MATLVENVNQAIADFNAIKNAIEDKGVNVGNVPTSEYAEKISKIEGTPSKHYLIKGFQKQSGVGVWGYASYRGDADIPFIRHYQAAQQIYVNSLIDLSKYSKIHCELMADQYRFYQAGISPEVRLLLLNTNVSNTIRDSTINYRINKDYIVKYTSLDMTNFVTDGSNYKYGAGILEIDISDINSGYIAVDVLGCLCYVSNMWLE